MIITALSDNGHVGMNEPYMLRRKEILVGNSQR